MNTQPTPETLAIWTEYLAGMRTDETAIDGFKLIEHQRDKARELLAKALIRGDLALEEAKKAKDALLWSDIQDKREMQRERDEARETLAAVTAQRDEALSDLEFRRQLYVVLAERCDRHTVELAETRVQRDRLAEALKEYREALSDGPENCSYKMYEAVDEFAEQALQSLTPNTEP